ncbi:MAG: AI-2E family transporter [Acutalibacteraceae bacterium]|nr:AI-2E family transporter [Acutalibacteraceae bacterium]
MELNTKNIKKILLIILFGACVFTAVQNYDRLFSFVSRIFGIFSPVITALCVAFVLNVLLTALETKAFKFMDKSKRGFVRKAKRPLCLVLTYLAAFGVIVLLIAFIIPDIAETFLYLAERLPSFMTEARVWIEDILEKFNLSQNLIPNITIDWRTVANGVKDYILGYSEAIFGSAVNFTTSFASGIYNLVFSVMISVYILACKERIGRFMTRLIDAFAPKKAAETVYHICSTTYCYFSKFIGGQLTESVILGMLFYVGMTIFRFPNAAIISILICVTSLVPIIGATIGVIVGFLLILITSPVKAILFILFFVVIQQIEGSLIYPRVVGKSVGLPGVIVVCAVLVGGNIGGIIGALIGVPVSAVLFVLVKETIEKRTPVPDAGH